MLKYPKRTIKISLRNKANSIRLATMFHFERTSNQMTHDLLDDVLFFNRWRLSGRSFLLVQKTYNQCGDTQDTDGNTYYDIYHSLRFLKKNRKGIMIVLMTYSLSRMNI